MVAHLVPVKTGASDGRRVEVLSGLSPGDRVIYRGNTYLREGDRVFATKWDAHGPMELPPAAPMEQMPGMGGPSGGKKAKPAEQMPGMEHGAEHNMPGMNH